MSSKTPPPIPHDDGHQTDPGRRWRVACPYLHHFRECKVRARAGGRVVVRCGDETHEIPEATYDNAAKRHMAQHDKQRADFSRAAGKLLGLAAWWALFVYGHLRYGWHRNPVELEARLAEDGRL